jgi:hypothetical protein
VILPEQVICRAVGSRVRVISQPDTDVGENQDKDQGENLSLLHLICISKESSDSGMNDACPTIPRSADQAHRRA